mmetsp:Transcript_13348/g.22693  ORF Transcript_13348/g.22693 Transcript_13348/m.22693 type:complete len:106 (+) Transcript_13348:517-834(+)
MLVHHIIGITGIVAALACGYGQVANIILTTAVEFSTVPLNYRSSYDKSEFGDFIPSVLQIIFFILFTVFRMILLPFAIQLALRNAQISWYYSSDLIKFAQVYSFL